MSTLMIIASIASSLKHSNLQNKWSNHEGLYKKIYIYVQSDLNSHLLIIEWRGLGLSQWVVFVKQEWRSDFICLVPI